MGKRAVLASVSDWGKGIGTRAGGPREPEQLCILTVVTAGFMSLLIDTMAENSPHAHE